jgi:hypothetical protein
MSDAHRDAAGLRDVVLACLLVSLTPGLGAGAVASDTIAIPEARFAAGSRTGDETGGVGWVGRRRPLVVPPLRPATATVAAAGHCQFGARLGGDLPYLPKAGVDWQVNGIPGGNAAVGTISSTGLYIAPMAAVAVTVSAVSRLDPTRHAEAPVTVLAPHRIGVRSGAAELAEFFDRSTGDVFTPRGNNYIRLANLVAPNGDPAYYHSTFDVGFYDAERAEAALADMAGYGYNVVRVWLNGCCTTSIGRPAGGLSPAYVGNVVDFLERSRAHGIYVILTTDWVPSLGGYSGHWAGCTQFGVYNVMNLCAGGVAANIAFFHDVAQALVDQGAPLDALMAYELRNEYYYDSDQQPLSWGAGLVTTANGRTYDMGSPASRQEMMDDGLVYFTDQVRAAIVAVDPTALVTVGFFWPQTPNPSRLGDPRWIEVYPAIAGSTADFVDIHGYAIPGELTVPQLIENYKLAGHQQEKPVLMGEFGAFKFSYASIADAALVLGDWMVQTCASQVKGWLLWTWDTEEPEQVPPLWTAMSGDGSINRSLAPAFRPDPCQ